MKNFANEVRAISTAVDLGNAVALSFPVTTHAANDVVIAQRQQAQQPSREITQAHFDQMRMRGSDCF